MSSLMHRRQFLATSGLAGLSLLGGLSLGRQARAEPLALTIQNARYALEATPTEGMVSLSPDAPPPVLRLSRGQPFRAEVLNTLDAYTSMHWHGLRLPNVMDGVPYLTQVPLGQGDRYVYDFTPQDAGTFWYHPHCTTMEQMAKGLTGLLIVEDERDPRFDLDLPVNLRDWRLGEDSQFIDLYTARGAARNGTFGTLMTANWASEPVYDVPAGGLVRFRLAATDTTRVYRLQMPGAEGRVIALDGHPVIDPVLWPGPEAPLVLGCGQRVDLAIRAPGQEGAELVLQNDQPGGPRVLLRLRAVGADLRHDLGDLAPLAANPLPEPDLAQAEVLDFVFGWSPSDAPVNDGFCGSLGYTFWSINRVAWPGDASGTGPLAELRLGQTYILRLRNESPNDHPIHLHGMVFKPLRSNRREVSGNWVDTAMLLAEETMEVALVADNPGDWAFHCHVIEHQKTGLTAYLRVA